MGKAKLLKSAAELPFANATAVAEYIDKGDLLAAKVNEAFLSRKDLHEIIGGEKNVQMMKDNHNNHYRFVGSILVTPDSEVLVDTVLWVFRAYMNRGFSSNYWAAQINAWIEVLKAELSESSFREIYPLYNWFSVNIPLFTQLSGENRETVTIT